MYSDAEFGVDSDFAIKHCLKWWFDWVPVDQSQNRHLKFQKHALLHIEMAVNPVKIDYFSISADVLRYRIRWRIWFCFQTLPESMIWLRYGRSKSERAVNARWVRKGLRESGRLDQPKRTAWRLLASLIRFSDSKAREASACKYRG